MASLQAPKQRPIIDLHPVEQIAYRRDIKDNGYKSVFTNSWLVRQWNRSWIKGLGKNPQKSELIHWRPPHRVPSDSEKHLQVYMSSCICHGHVWRVDAAPVGTLSQSLFWWRALTAGRTVCCGTFCTQSISYIAYSCKNKFTNYTTSESVFEKVSKSSTDQLCCSSSSVDGGYTDTDSWRTKGHRIVSY